MKEIAIVEYTFIFEPGVTYTRGSEFENDLRVFFASHGYDAQAVQTTGGTGRRVMSIGAMQAPQQPKVESTQSNAVEQVRKIQQSTAPKDFKAYRRVQGVPIHARVHGPKMSRGVGFQQRIPGR